MIDTNKHICNLLLKDNKQGMSLLFKKYFETLVIWADTFLNDMDQSKDLVQDFFIKIWRKKSYRDWNAETLASYLRVAIKNACYNKLKNSNRLKYVTDMEKFDQIYEEFEANKEEIVFKIFEEVEKLPKKSREVVKCVYLKGMKYREVADELNVSVATVKTQLVRSLKSLRISSEKLGDFFFLYCFTKKIKKPNRYEIFG